MEQYYKIAGLTVRLDTFGHTEHLLIPYRVKPTDAVDFEIIPERTFAEEKGPFLTADQKEALATYRVFFIKLLDYDGMLLHSSAVVKDGKAYLFTANSGTGKSTHTKIWRQVFGDEGVRVINDDKPAIRFEDGSWYVYGTPWSGKSDFNLNVRVPLAGICILQRGEENTITRASVADAVADIFLQTARPKNADVRMKVLGLLDKLLSQVPVWKLRCNMEPEAAIVAYEAMSGQKYEGDWK